MNRQELHPRLCRLPAEWEPQSAVQLTWPHAQTDWAPYLGDITKTYVSLAEVISRYEPLLIAAQEPDAVRKLLPAQTQFPIAVVPCRNNDTWARDHAFITLTASGPEGSPSAHFLDFGFNGWGEKFPSDLDNALNRSLFSKGIFKGHYENHLDFILEGGSIETDGEGTLYTTSQCLLAPHRNQPLSRPQIEEQLKQRLHVGRVVWLDYGNLIGDDTDGHIDTIVRCAPANTLLYIRTEDTRDPHYEDLLALRRQLEQLSAPVPEGAPSGLHLLPLPLPLPIFDGADRLPATYANFLIVNGAVIVPVYGQSDLDAEACRIIGSAFPGRDIIPLDSRTIIRQHGSIHCITMQYPVHALDLTPFRDN